MLVDPDGYWVWLAVNAGFAAYDGYKAGKNKKQIAWAAASNFGPSKAFKGAKSVVGLAKKINGNSLLSTKANHGYEIYRKVNGKKRIVKVSISGGKISQKGKSYRATRQANKWSRKSGEVYYIRTVQKNMTRKNALRWEQGHVNRVARGGGEFSSTYHRKPMPR